MRERYETFTTLINRINRSIRRIKNREMAEYNLRSVHVSCLYYLYRGNDMTATDLCEHCEEDKATISRALLYLEEQGFLAPRMQGKRYKTPLVLSVKGEKAGKKIAKRIEYVLEDVSSGLSERERKVLYRCLSVISAGLEEISKGSEK